VQISFWGVRGSIPAPERQAWRYGGNTPCVEVRAGNEVIILDAGTGIRDLGINLAAELVSPGLTAHLLLTHYHWDQVLGLPFFEPVYFAGNTIHIYGPRPQGSRTHTLEDVIDTVFLPPFFPVTREQLQSTLVLHELDWESEFAIGDVGVRTCRTNHPQGSLAFRIEADGGVFVYATDHEPGDAECDAAVRRLSNGADVLVSDAQYRPEEMGAKHGWGHGDWKSSVGLARETGAKNLMLFHHEPVRTDDELDRILSETRRDFPNTWIAAEGMSVEISNGRVRMTTRAIRLSQRAEVRLTATVETHRSGMTQQEAAQLANISLFGAYFYSRAAYTPHQPVEVVLPRAQFEDAGGEMPNGQAAPAELRLRGYVLRIDPVAGEPGLHGIAVYFPGATTPAEMKALRHLPNNPAQKS